MVWLEGTLEIILLQSPLHGHWCHPLVQVAQGPSNLASKSSRYGAPKISLGNQCQSSLFLVVNHSHLSYPNTSVRKAIVPYFISLLFVLEGSVWSPWIPSSPDWTTPSISACVHRRGFPLSLRAFNSSTSYNILTVLHLCYVGCSRAVANPPGGVSPQQSRTEGHNPLP